MSRTAAALLDLARAEGLEVRINGTGIKVCGPSDAVARWVPLLRPHKVALWGILTGNPGDPTGPLPADALRASCALSEAPPPLTRAGRAAIQEHDGGLPRVDADAQARSAMRVYRVLVAMDEGEPDRWITMLAPHCGLPEAAESARRQFGAHRVRSVVEQERRA